MCSLLDYYIEYISIFVFFNYIECIYICVFFFWLFAPLAHGPVPIELVCSLTSVFSYQVPIGLICSLTNVFSY
jgi:hypothetical protein